VVPAGLMPCACLAGLLLRVGLEAGSCPRLYSGLKARSAGKSYAPTRSAAGGPIHRFKREPASLRSRKMYARPGPFTLSLFSHSLWCVAASNVSCTLLTF
jgi:hypothetical protein